MRPNMDARLLGERGRNSAARRGRHGGPRDLKMQALRALGVPQRDLYLTMGRDKVGGPITVLIVRSAKRLFVLDDLGGAPFSPIAGRGSSQCSRSATADLGSTAIALGPEPRRKSRPAKSGSLEKQLPVTLSEPLAWFVRFATEVSSITGDLSMKITRTLAVAAGIAALAACNQSPQEQAADNIEANAEMTADNLEEAADNAPTEATEDALENQADAIREAGEENADATRTGADADGNSAN